MANPFRTAQDRRGGRSRGPGLHLCRPRGLGAECHAGPDPQAGQAPLHTANRLATTWSTAKTRWRSTPTPIAPGAKVLVVDDLLATGGTVEACCRLVEKVGGVVVGCAFLIELAGLQGVQRIARYKTVSLVKYE